MNRPFEKLLGTTPELLILEELIAATNGIVAVFTLEEVRDMTEISMKKIKKVIKKFMKWNVITKTIETAGPFVSSSPTTAPIMYYEKVTAYNLNPESPYVKAIIAFNNALIEDAIGEKGLYKIHDYLEEMHYLK